MIFLVAIAESLGKLFTDPSMRRHTLALAGVVAVAGNQRLNLGLTPESVLELLTFIGGVIAASTTKEAVIKRAEAAAVIAVAKVAPGADADAVVDAAAQVKP